MSVTNPTLTPAQQALADSYAQRGISVSFLQSTTTTPVDPASVAPAPAPASSNKLQTLSSAAGLAGMGAGFIPKNAKGAATAAQGASGPALLPATSAPQFSSDGIPYGATSAPLTTKQLEGIGNGTVYWDPITGQASSVGGPGTYRVNVSTAVNADGTKVITQSVNGQVPLPNTSVQMSGVTFDTVDGKTTAVGAKATLGQDAEFGGGAIGAAVAGNTLFSGIQNLMDHGITLGHLATAIGSFLGLALGLHLMHLALIPGGVHYNGAVPWPIAGVPATWVLLDPTVVWLGGVGAMLQAVGTPWLPKILFWLTSAEGILAVGGLIVAAAIITDLLHGKPSSAETSLSGLPVYSAGNVLAVVSTAAFLSMGYNIDSPMLLTDHGISVPTSSLQLILGPGSKAPLQYASGKAYDGADGAIPDDGTPIVITGPNGTNDRVIEITKKDMNNDYVKVINLTDNLHFSAPTDTSGAATDAAGAYLSFSINGKLDALAVNNSKHASDLLAACQQGILDPVSCQTALTLAASKNKNITANTSPSK